MSKVTQHAEAFEAAASRVATTLGFDSTEEYIQSRAFAPKGRGTRFLAVEVLNELRREGWELRHNDEQQPA